jgi:Lrp/AsnC family transcriptional regulator, regulator for asnA, asnC and gidA
MVISDKDLAILSHLRRDARTKVTNIAQMMDMPATTVYEKIRTHKKKGIVTKHVSLLDFSKLGYNATAYISVSPNQKNTSELLEYLANNDNVNSLFLTNSGDGLLFEVIFENMLRLQEFIDHLNENYHTKVQKIWKVAEEYKRENFLTKEFKHREEI